MDPNKDDENYEKDYDDAFEEASGEGTGASQEEQDFADESGEGGEPAEKAAGAESGNDDADVEDAAAGSGDEPAAEGADDSDGADAADDEGGEGQQKADGDEPQHEADADKGAPKYDEETVRKAAELLSKQQGKGEQPTEEPAAEEQGQQEQPVDFDKVTWEDYVPEDKKDVVEKYKQEWSEVHEAEEVIRNAQLQLIQERLYSDLRSALAPVFETTQKLQVNAHLDAIRQTHPDLDDIRGELNEWIDQQPEFVRPAYKQVATKGSAKEVVELINQFKQAKGKTGAVPEVPASSARQQQQQRKPAQKQPPAAAKKALAAAPSPSTADVPGSANPDDFDSAWEEAAAGLG